MANEKLIDSNKYPCRNCGKTYCHQNCKEFIDWLENTVDAVEVVHGRWIKHHSNRFECDCCNVHFITCRAKDWNYCPNCGADMRGENNGK